MSEETIGDVGRITFGHLLSDRGGLLRPMPPARPPHQDEGGGDEPEDDESTIEDRIRNYIKHVKELRRGLLGAGISEEENVTALILSFFEQEGLR